MKKKVKKNNESKLEELLVVINIEITSGIILSGYYQSSS